MENDMMEVDMKHKNGESEGKQKMYKGSRDTILKQKKQYIFIRYCIDNNISC